jgi:hypothetical protein
MRIIPTRIHGLLDYLVGALLVAFPWLFGFDRGGVETWLPVLLGLGAILYSIFTDYEMGAVRRIPMPTHLLLDAGSGVLLAASPWLFGFADHVWQPHLCFGLFEIVASLMTQRRPSRSGSTGFGPAATGHRSSGATRI